MIEVKAINADNFKNEYQKMQDARLQFKKDQIKILNKYCCEQPILKGCEIFEVKDLKLPYVTNEKYDLKIHHINPDSIWYATDVEIVRKKTNKSYQHPVCQTALKDAEHNYQHISQFNFRDDPISATLIALIIQSELYNSMPQFLSVFARRLIDPEILDQNRIERILRCLD